MQIGWDLNIFKSLSETLIFESDINDKGKLDDGSIVFPSQKSQKDIQKKKLKLSCLILPVIKMF